jgi:DnaJ family protein C protein 3
MQHIMQLSGSTDPHLQISALSFYSLGDTDKGLASIRKCLQSDPDNKECRKIMRREKPVDKRIKQLNALWAKGSFASSVKLLIKTSEDQGLIQDVLDDFEELQKEGVIHEKAPNGLHAQMIERACQAYIEVCPSHRDHRLLTRAAQKIPQSEAVLRSRAGDRPNLAVWAALQGEAATGRRGL